MHKQHKIDNYKLFYIFLISFQKRIICLS